MATRESRVFDEVDALPTAERLKLVDYILDSLDKPDPAIETVIASEKEKND